MHTPILFFCSDFVLDAGTVATEQLGNSGFLNQDLMERARKGPGVRSDSKLKVGIVGAGLAGMVAAMDLADAGHEVDIFELRPFVGGKVSSWLDKEGNHIEMGLHVFFGCYYNLFGIMQRTGSFELLRLKEHVHTFVNEVELTPPPHTRARTHTHTHAHTPTHAHTYTRSHTYTQTRAHSHAHARAHTRARTQR